MKEPLNGYPTADVVTLPNEICRFQDYQRICQQGLQCFLYCIYPPFHFCPVRANPKQLPDILWTVQENCFSIHTTKRCLNILCVWILNFSIHSEGIIQIP